MKNNLATKFTVKFWKNKITHHFEEVVKTKHSPESLAYGFSIGTFLGLLPLPFINILIGFLIILIFKNVSKYSLIFSIFFWNSLIQLPLTLLSYELGNLIFGDSVVIRFDVLIINQIINITRRYIVGNLIVALLTSIIIYFISLQILKNIKSINDNQ